MLTKFVNTLVMDLYIVFVIIKVMNYYSRPPPIVPPKENKYFAFWGSLV